MKTLDKFLESRFHDDVPTLGDIIHHWAADWHDTWGLSKAELVTIVMDGLHRIERQIDDDKHQPNWDWQGLR